MPPLPTFVSTRLGAGAGAALEGGVAALGRPREGDGVALGSPREGDGKLDSDTAEASVGKLLRCSLWKEAEQERETKQFTRCLTFCVHLQCRHTFLILKSLH